MINWCKNCLNTSTRPRIGLIKEVISQYLKYYKISKKEFNSIIDKYANKKLFKKVKDRWVPKFKII